MVAHSVSENGGRILLEMLESLRVGAKKTKTPGVTVRIFAAADLDGVCSTKILITLLQRDGVKYTVIPVTGNTDIHKNFSLLSEQPEVQHVVLLNCGAGLDLAQALRDSDAPKDIYCYVIDAHRPVLLPNMEAHADRIVVINDDPIALANGIEPPVDEEHDEDSSTAGSDDEDGEAHLDDEAPGDPSRIDRKRRRRLEREQRHVVKRRRVNEYYLNTYYATPVAVSLFKLARQAAPPSLDMLWVAALSLTGYLDLGLISKSEYDRQAWEELNETLETIDSLTIGSTQSGARTKVKALRFEPELQLPFYKQWTLEEAVNHSSYFYGTLELHRKKGQHALKAFLTTAGIPIRDFRQFYGTMKLPIQKGLRSKFCTHGKAFGLMESKMTLQQFVRRLPDGPLGQSEQLYLHELSCTDAVRIITAILTEIPASLSAVNEKKLPQLEQGGLDVEAVNEMERAALVSNFFRAFDAVLCKEPDVLRIGLERALEEAKAVQSLARDIREERSMHATRNFRWCKVEFPPHVLRHYLSVRRLAVWLLQVLFTFRPQGAAADKPLLVIVRDHLRDSYLCVGAAPPKLAEQDEFSSRYRNVMRYDKTIKFRYDFFDKSCIEISSDDFDKFWAIVAGSEEPEVEAD